MADLLITVQLGSALTMLEGHSHQQIDRLVTTNWIRTAAWTGRGVVALIMAELATR